MKGLGRTAAWWWISAIVFGFAGAAAALENADCFACHSVPDMSKTNPDGTTLSLHVDNDAYAASVHAGLECVACHTDITEVPHPEGLKKVDCALCHESQAKVYLSLIHI